ncbi:hypothetical protein QN277_028797 [Acacia crassicarpa]|uniref:WAT1-related protein n=1 Tax=Acacia crassicarpa TaxID=499986 RepID=A0AAE1MFJ4_9FABA|nr:hypothetical protein QN277_028797 [Acacia crassicarpa]
MTKNIREVVDGLKPTILMVVVQLFYVGVNILYKLVFYDGMDLRIVIVYRFVFATAFMAPLALIFERKNRPKMTWTILFQGLICGLFGLEKLNWKAAAGKAKIIGTLAGTSGAMLLTFYRGARIPTPSFHVTLLQPHKSYVASSHSSSGGNTLLGALCGLGYVSSYSLWLIVQGKMSERYPCHYSSTTLINLTASMFSTGFALCTVRDWSQWKLGWNIRLVTVAYAGLVSAGLCTVIIAWCVCKGGPLFISVFNPLQLLFLSFVGSFFMDEMLHIGSIIGGVMIVCGLYLVLRGKGLELKNKNLLGASQTLHVSSSPEISVKSSIDDDKGNHSNNISTSNLDRDYSQFLSQK